MTAFAHKSTAFEIQSSDRRGVRLGPVNGLTLRATGDGWALLGPEGEIVFRGLGVRGRHACLEFARERGVLAVFS